MEYEKKKVTKIKEIGGNLNFYSVDPELVKLFAGRSYAIVKHSFEEADQTDVNNSSHMDRFTEANNRFFVPILWRTFNQLRSLFWCDPVKVVINGEEETSLCMFCSKLTECEGKGIGEERTFECRATKKLLVLKQ